MTRSLAILYFSRPLSGLYLSRNLIPSDKSLGYFQSSAARTQLNKD